MEYRRLGRTGLEVSLMSQGTGNWALTDFSLLRREQGTRIRSTS